MDPGLTKGSCRNDAYSTNGNKFNTLDFALPKIAPPECIETRQIRAIGFAIAHQKHLAAIFGPELLFDAYPCDSHDVVRSEHGYDALFHNSREFLPMQHDVAGLARLQRDLVDDYLLLLVR